MTNRILVNLKSGVLKRLAKRVSATKAMEASLVLMATAFSAAPAMAQDLDLPQVSEQQSQSFVLQGVKFSGNTVFSQSELQAVIQDYIGKSVTISDLEGLRLALTQHYLSQGYINSGAVLPVQDVVQGVVEVSIIEGRLTDIQVTGGGHLRPSYSSERLLQASGKVFNLPRFQEQYQLLINDPNIEQLDGRFVPGSELGSSQLLLDVTPAQRFHWRLQADNFGAPSTGDNQLFLQGHIQNLGGWGDELHLNVSKKEGADGLELRYASPLSALNNRFGLSVAINDSKVIEDQLDSLDIKNDFKSYEFFYSHPVIKSLSTDVTLTTTLSVRENAGRLLNIPFSFSPGEQQGIAKVTALRFSALASHRTSRDLWSVYARVSKGLPAFNATINDGDLPDSDFTTLLLQGQYVRRLWQGKGQLSWRADVQLSDRPLLSLEQLALGGHRSVRGYRENELVRDTGFATSVQIEGDLWDKLDFGGRFGALQWLTFMDYGKGKFKSQQADIAEPLWSVGLGLKWQAWQGFEFDLSYAYALKDAREKTNEVLQDQGVHLRMSYDLL